MKVMHILPHSSRGKLAGLCFLTVAGACYSLCKGAITLSPEELLFGLSSDFLSGGSLSMIMHLRLVRIASALLCGSALSLSGLPVATDSEQPNGRSKPIGYQCLSCSLGTPWHAPLSFSSTTLATILLHWSTSGKRGGILPCCKVSLQSTYAHSEWYCIIYNTWSDQRCIADNLS